MALVATISPAAALAAPQAADAQGTTVAAAAEESSDSIATASVPASTESGATVRFQVTSPSEVTKEGLMPLYQVRPASDAAPSAPTMANLGAFMNSEDGEPDESGWRIAQDQEGYITYWRYQEGAASYEAIDVNVNGLKAGTDYVVYYAFRGGNNYSISDVQEVTFTTTGVGADSVTHGISALVSGDFDADAVAAARADYNKLGEEQQAQVANADVLTAAEAVVSARAEAAQAKSDADAAKTAQKEAEEAQAKAEKALSDYQAAHPAVQANTMTARAAKKTVKAKALKKKAQQVKIVVGKAQGKVTYKKAKKSGIYKKATVSKKGVVTLKKGAKKGTYKFKVTAAGNAGYSAKTVTVSIKVK